MQFLKFQAFAEQLTKETSELKVKIENHKRENRRLTTLIDQQKDDAARLTLRLSGTEKQRDDALEALVLQQEIAEELERERKRNQKEISALEDTNSTLSREREEAQRVVIHLRSLINAKAHHMEHIVRSLGNAESADYTDAPEDIQEEDEEDAVADTKQEPTKRSTSRASTVNGKDDEKAAPEVEKDVVDTRKYKRFSALSMSDVADRHLRDKTDAISDIIRNISEQCAAAVAGLQLAHDELDDMSGESNNLPTGEYTQSSRTDGSDMGDDSGLLSPDRSSSVPPTPDLVHNRSSTSMSMVSSSTIHERSSQQYGPGEIPTKIVENDDEHALHAAHEHEVEQAPISKQSSHSVMAPSSTRIVS